MKYSGLYALTKPLAQIMVAAWPDWESPPELILPVPLHPQRRKKRGFNQSELLATYLSQGLNFEVNSSCLIRVKNTIPQVGLSPEKRRENVKDAFKSDPEFVFGKKILLIDDVFTTGATMLAAADALIAAGAASVSAYCLARTV